MKAYCIADKYWVDEVTNKPCDGPRYGDIVTVIGELFINGRQYYVLKEWPPVEPDDSYCAEHFIPLSEISETVIHEQVKELV